MGCRGYLNYLKVTHNYFEKIKWYDSAVPKIDDKIKIFIREIESILKIR